MTDIVKKKGRKPYDRSIPRLAINGYEDRQPEEDYISWQSKINTGPEGTVDEDVLEEYLSGRDYFEVDPKNIGSISTGSRLGYITKNNKWRSAGWLSSVEDSFTDYEGNSLKKPKKYVVYKSYNNACFSVQVSDVDMFYVLKRLNDVVTHKILYFKKPTKRTNFPVIVENDKGEEVVIHYARDKHNQQKFMDTEKYKKAQEDSTSWLFDDYTQVDVV